MRSMQVRDDVGDMWRNSADERLYAGVQVDVGAVEGVGTTLYAQDRVALELSVIAVVVRRIVRALVGVRRDRHADRQLAGMAEHRQKSQNKNE